MKTDKKFGLIGGVLGHSFSPQIHNFLGGYEYKLCELKKTELEDFFKSCPLSGFNVTIPYKEEVIKYLDKISDRAKRIGSINTVIKCDDGSFYGDNTDYAGFSALLGEGLGRGEKALILGSGGSSKTVRAVLEDRGYKAVVISRSGDDNYDNISRHYDAEIIVNTTPVGMYPNNCQAVISLENFKNCRLVLDLIYNPIKTALILEAERLQIECRGGLLMLCEQARAASELFTGGKIEGTRSYEIKDALEKRMKNIVLIGMPGSGKSSIGQRLAELLGREFADTDKLFEEKYKISAGEMIEKKGAGAFREAESEILSEVCKKSGFVIATGGGIVTVDKNRDIIRQNSSVVFTDRVLSELATDGRPLSAAYGVQKLYSERIDNYLSWSDYKVSVQGVDKTAEDILNTLGLGEKT